VVATTQVLGGKREQGEPVMNTTLEGGGVGQRRLERVGLNLQTVHPDICKVSKDGVEILMRTKRRYIGKNGLACLQAQTEKQMMR